VKGVHFAAPTLYSKACTAALIIFSSIVPGMYPLIALRSFVIDQKRRCGQAALCVLQVVADLLLS